MSQELHISNKMNRNYQKELEKELAALPDCRRRLLMHSCCAPCSSYCLEYLRQYFSITVFYYNPNISLPMEYRHRVEEQKRLIGELNQRPEGAPVSFLEGPYEPERYLEAVKGWEDCPEGGKRCHICYELRLREAARLAKKSGFDYFVTTLSISPLKDAKILNEIGERLSQEYGVRYLPSDFKKKGGYQRSVEMSREYGLYRQDFCGCAFSKAQRDAEKNRQQNKTKAKGVKV